MVLIFTGTGLGVGECQLQGPKAGCERRAGAVTDGGEWGSGSQSQLLLLVLLQRSCPSPSTRPVHDSGHSAASCSGTRTDGARVQLQFRTGITPSPRLCALSRWTDRTVIPTVIFFYPAFRRSRRGFSAIFFNLFVCLSLRQLPYPTR